VPVRKFKNEKEKQSFVEEMQKLAINNIDFKYTDSRNTLKEMRSLRRATGWPMGDENVSVYKYVGERKIALLSYIANFPEYVDEAMVNKMSATEIVRYDRTEQEAEGYTEFGKNIVNLKYRGKFAEIENMPQEFYIHETIHTTSFWNKCDKELKKMPAVEVNIYHVLEEGITQAKTEKIMSSVEFRELCKQFDIKKSKHPIYEEEQIIASSLDILNGGELFYAHCQDREKFDNVLKDIFSKEQKLKFWLSRFAQNKYGENPSLPKATYAFQQYCNELLPIIGKSNVSQDNVLQILNMYHCTDRAICLAYELPEEMVDSYCADMDNFKDVLYNMLEGFEFDKTAITKVQENSGKECGTTCEDMRDYLNWLDETGLTKTDTYAKFLYQKLSNELRIDDNMRLYYNEAMSTRLKKNATEGDIWAKASEIAKFREDNESFAYINMLIQGKIELKNSITPKNKNTDNIFEGEEMDLNNLGKF